MVIFQPIVADDYEWINCVRPEDDYEIFAAFDGSPRAAEWEPVMVRRVRADKRHGFKPSDFPWNGSHALIMRKKAVDALRDLLESAGEILPLSTEDDTELFVLNVTRVLDAIDEGGSQIQRFPDSGRIMRIESIAFKESVVKGVDLFRLPHRMSATYASERFVIAVEKAGLVGLEFDKVWESS